MSQLLPIHGSFESGVSRAAEPPAIPLRLGDAGDIRLARWRENVGCALCHGGVAGRAATAAEPGVVVLSWNVWIGRGRLAEVVRRVREGAYAELGIPAEAPLVILVQEAFRSDPSVPERSNGWAPRERPRELAPREDVVEVARRLHLDLVYVPSMRNGALRSDRGNAILSDLPLEEPSAFELPFVAQRRVPLTATVRVPAGGETVPLSVCSAHLDPWGTPGRDWLGAAGRAVQARDLLESLERGGPSDSRPLVLGADLNTTRGRREAAYRLLRDAGFTVGVPHHVPAWTHTYHVMPRLPIDWLLLRDTRGAIAGAAVHRLSENPRDRGPTVFGSDHHPLIAFVRLEPRMAEPA